jgi:hypothetical protein
MIRATLFLVAIAALSFGGSLSAGEPCAKSLGQELKCMRCMSMPCRCCDDYCRKPMPCIPCVRLGTCPDNYCRKPMPCVTCPARSCCPNNYCRKPLPNLCWPVDHGTYRCPPPERGNLTAAPGTTRIK